VVGTYSLTGFADRVAVVTGAGRMKSIGKSIALELARAGCNIALTSTGRQGDSERADERTTSWQNVDSLAGEIEQLGRQAITLQTDIANPDDCERLTDGVIGRYGRIDILVNAAAAPLGRDRVPVVELEPDAWRQVIDINLTGAFYLGRAVAQRMIAGGRGGSIVNISSIAGKVAGPDRGAYAASKSGLNALTASMAKELGPQGIRVNAICPGWIPTGRGKSVPDAELTSSAAQKGIVLGRPGTPLDIATLAVFLASDQGAWITGQNWNVDGGQLMTF
jgi:3-oxoacyl-[acyl-carrier protein] reductase